jgi:glucokinase
MTDPDTQETLSAFASIVDDVQADLDTQGDPDAAATAVLNHHERSLEALESFCEPLGLNPNDLIVVLTA